MPTLLYGQQDIPRTVGLKECLQFAIESNYGVKIARNREQIAANNITGSEFLPVVTAGARGSREFIQLRNGLFGNNPDETRHYAADAYAADISLVWRIFDGMAMFASFDTKRELLSAGELNLRNNLEGLVADVSDQYYYIVTQQNRLEAVRTYLNISTIRYNQAQEKYSIGALSGLELTQAKIDFNADSSRVVLQEQLLRNAYIQLFQLMNAPLDSQLSVDEPVMPVGNLRFEELMLYASDHNTSILLARTGQNIAGNDLKIARSSRYPTLDFTSGYRFSHTEGNSVGTRYIRLHGPNIGLTFSTKLFTGFEIRRSVRNAAIEVENQDLTYRQTALNVESALSQTYNVYRKNLTMIGFETESAEAAFKNLEAAVEMYRLGSMSGTDFREIQRSYIEAENRKLDALYQAKSSEITLLYLSGLIL